MRSKPGAQSSLLRDLGSLHPGCFRAPDYEPPNSSIIEFCSGVSRSAALLGEG